MNWAGAGANAPSQFRAPGAASGKLLSHGVRLHLQHPGSMPASAADPGFQDSEFDWDALNARSPAERPQRGLTGMDHLAWAVLVLLTFCPPLAFAIAFLW